MLTSLRKLLLKLVNITSYIKVFFILLFVTGCTVKPSVDKAAQINILDQSELKAWSISGRIAWITPDERKSAYLNWSHKRDNEEINSTFILSSVLGIQLATLTQNQDGASLLADDETFYGRSARELIYRITGWDVPIESLSRWIKGNGFKNNTAIEEFDIYRYPNGLISMSKPKCNNCDAWEISYTEYAVYKVYDKDFTLPKAITLKHTQNQSIIKLKISDWDEFR